MIKYILLLIFALIPLVSCVTQKRCESKFGECGRLVFDTITSYRDTTLFIKGATIYDTLNFYRTDTVLLKDSTGKLTAQIGTIKGTETKWIRIISKPDTIVVTKYSERIKEAKVKYVNRDKIPIIYWIALCSILFLLIYSHIRR